MQTDKAVAAFITSRQARNLRPKTLEYYRWCLGPLARFVVLPTAPMDLEVVMAEATGRLSPESCYDLWRGLRAFYRWVCARYPEVANPLEKPGLYGKPQFLVVPPLRPHRLPRVLRRDQVALLLEKGCQSAQDRALVLLELDNGIRLGEIASMEKEHIGGDTLRVQGKRGTREVPLSREVMLQLLMLGGVDYPWMGRQGRLTAKGIQHAFKRIFQRAGVKGSPHCLRHTFATEYLRRGGNVFSLQRILGHRDLTTTLVYTHLVHNDLIEQHRKFSPARDWFGAADAADGD